MTKPRSDQHRNDMYGNVDARSEEDAGVTPVIPAATVVLLRDAPQGCEVLMLRKNTKINFGGMWVFPGGKIDPQDYPKGIVANDTLASAAKAAAVREAHEEAGLQLQAEEFVWFAHWTPPPGPQKRFATWFFVADISTQDDTDPAITIDDGEIKDHLWVTPAQALEKHARGEIDLVPPTWVTLHHLSLYSPTAQVLAHFRANDPKTYATRVVPDSNGVRVAMWSGDAGYDEWMPDTPGERHRLTMAATGFVFDNSVEPY